MSFVYPLGLLGLIGVPILIIIYIIKNKYTEQIIPSTYLWELSEKFLKKKKPISFISGLISLLLQITAVVAISLAIAHPIITLPNAAKEYCFVLDASGSMSKEINEVSRMELGKEKIKEIITESSDGSNYTLIYAGDTTRVVYEKLANKEKAIELLMPLDSTGVTVSFKSAMNYVQGLFNSNDSMLTYVVTDRDYDSSNVEIINVGGNENNYAVINGKYMLDKRNVYITCSLISYESDENLTVNVYVNDVLESSEEVSVLKLEETKIDFISNKVNFDSIKIEIENSDGLISDNVYYMYNVDKAQEYKTLLVSDRPFYLKTAIETVGNTAITVVSTYDYNDDISGYNLYIFDSYSPSKLPSDGTIWLFGVTNSVNGAGFAVQETYEIESSIDLETGETIYDSGFEVIYPKNSLSLFKTLTNGLLKEKIYVSKYSKYGLYRDFTILMICDGNPVVFTGLGDSGNREVVFAFDLHDSNFTMLMDYLQLTKNLLDYSFPSIIDNLSYVCGDTVTVNVLSNCGSIRVDSPNGNVSYLDVSNETSEFNLIETGVYKMTVSIGDDEKVFNIFSSLPSEERSNSLEVVELSLQGELGDDYIDGIYDKLIILFIILTVIYMADWMVYCYEQYQLR